MRPDRPARGLGARLGLLLFSLALTALVLEGGLRLLGYRPPELLTPALRQGYRLEPNGRFVYRGYLDGMFSDFATPVQLNSLGFHDVEHAPARATPDTYRLMVIGDSYVAALSCPLETTFPRLLEGRLKSGNPFRRGGYEVIAFGRGNQAQAAERAYVERYGPTYRPDAVLLLFFCGNDIMENSSETFDAAGRFATRYKKIIAPRKLACFEKIRVLPSSRLNGLVAVGVTTFYAHHLHWFTDDVEAKDLVSPELGVYRVPLAPEWERAYEQTARQLILLKQEVAKLGVPLLVAGLSGPQAIGDVGSQLVQSGAGAGLDTGRPAAWLAEWCRTNDVPHLALEPALAAAGRRTVFWPHDGHLNPRGNQVIVDPLYRLLLDHAPMP